MAIRFSKLYFLLMASLLLSVSDARAMATLPSSKLATLIPSTATHLPIKDTPVKTQLTRSSPSNGIWALLGCFDDTWVQSSMLKVNNTNPGSMPTIEFCQSQRAAEPAYVFVALEKGNVCYCGYDGQDVADHLIARKLDDDQCNIPCEGDSSRTCGGNTQINLYKFVVDGASAGTVATPDVIAPATTVPEPTATTAPLTPPSAGVGWRDVGCFVDNGTNRLLTQQFDSLNDNPTMTIEVCQTGCQAYGFDLAGVEFGLECWCDMESRTGQLQMGGNADNCTFSCLGNQAEMCGGLSSVYVYKYGAWNSTTISTSISTSVVTRRVTVAVTATRVRTSTMDLSHAASTIMGAYATTTLASVPPSNCSKTVTVATGDSCWKIWTGFNLTEAEFRVLNPSLFPECLIYPGDVLCLENNFQSTASSTQAMTSGLIGG